jgi:putative peptidoglycan lipid II flippase
MFENLIKILFDEKIKYNILSLLNITIGFLFTVLLGKEFGVGNETDIFFYSLVIINYLGLFIQSIWEAFTPNYIRLKVDDQKKSIVLYSILLNNIIIVSSIIIVLYYIITNLHMFTISEQLRNYLNIYIVYILFQNILYYNKNVLNLERFYASYYLVDIFIYSTASLFLIFFNVKNIVFIAYLMITTTVIAVIWQFYLIFKVLNFKYSLTLYEHWLNEIYKNSIKYKIGTMIYGVKDIILVSFFTGLGAGFYSLYSYADKFASTVSMIVNAPIVNIFITKVNYFVAHNHYNQINKLIKRVLSQTTIFFSIASLLVYLLLPSLLQLFFSKAMSENDILIINNIYLYLLLFNFIIIIESPYAKTIIAFKHFNYMIFINAVFLLIFSLAYLISNTYKMDYGIFLLFLSIAQFSNLVLYYSKYKSTEKNKRKIE